MFDCKEGYVIRKLQRNLSAIETWFERWNIKISEDKTQVIYFSYRIRPPEVHLTLNGRNVPFVHHVTYVGVIFDKRITWRLHIEMIEAKAFRTFIRMCQPVAFNWLHQERRTPWKQQLSRRPPTQWPLPSTKLRKQSSYAGRP
jgi:hypothetical protein